MIIFGEVCRRHPELQGRRYSSSMNRCTGCAIENNLRNKERYDKAWRKWHAKPEVKRRSSDATLRWARENPGKHTANVLRYKARKANRTPAWADLEKIKSIYVRAAELGLTVDHAIPLRGKRVSGLHVETNLVMLSKSENSSKGNSFNV